MNVCNVDSSLGVFMNFHYLVLLILQVLATSLNCALDDFSNQQYYFCWSNVSVSALG